MLVSVKGARARKSRFDSAPASRKSGQAEGAVTHLPARHPGVPDRVQHYLRTASLPSPCLVVDIETVAGNYEALANALPEASIFYAVKANPADEILARLASHGSCFDTASIGEIELCLRRGIDAGKLSFGNTIKKQRDIAAAYNLGVRMFAFDSEAELLKIATSAPGARVFCRILVDCEGAEWPLSRKFGCEPEMAADLMVRARDLGLDTYGISFHVGSQQTRLEQYDRAIAQASRLFRTLSARGVELRMLNVGGGFPSRYSRDVPPITAYAQAIRDALALHFPQSKLDIIVEPGRYIVGDAGVIQAEVVLVSDKGGSDPRRWVYLDIGKFHGLIETMDEAIRYRILTPHDGSETVPVILAGPTCDSADILYEKADYRLPKALKAGDRVLILSTGAYTTTYASVAFNGMPPLASVCI
jgi:ornithine decarboxylase